MYDTMKTSNKIYILSALNNGLFKPLTEWINTHNGAGAELIESQHINNLYLRCLAGSWKAIRNTRRNDTIVCMYDFQGVLLYWLCMLCFTNRNIVIINVLNKCKSGFIHKLYNYLYKKAMTDSKHTRTTVTSMKYGDWLNDKLGIDVEYRLLRDCNMWYYKYDKIIDEKPNTVFCGGNNARDWDFIVALAKEMPNVNFILMPGTNRYNYYMEKGINSNITIYPNVPYDKFMDEEMSASIVAMPLETEAPAGLIAIYQAGINNKFVITTETATMSDYIGENRGQMIEKDIELWKQTIDHYLANPKLRKEKAKNLHDFIENDCSPIKYYTSIMNIANSFTNV